MKTTVPPNNLAAKNFRQYLLIMLAGCSAVIAVAHDIRVAVLLIALAFVAVVSASRLFTALLLAALFLPFQRLLAAELGGFSLKISQIIFMIVITKIFLNKVVLRDPKLIVARFSLPTFAFAFVSLVSILWSPEPRFSVAIASWMLFSILLAHAVINLVITREQMERVIYFMIYGGIVASVFGMYQFFAVYLGLPSFIKDMYGAQSGYIARVQSTALEPLHYAGYLITIIPFVLALYISKQNVISRPLLKFSLILMVLNLVLTVSRSGYIALIVAAVLVYKGIDSKYKDTIRTRSVFRLGILVCVLCLILITALSLTSVVQATLTTGSVARAGSSMQRLAGFIVAVKMFISHPIFGTGIGSFGHYFYGSNEHGTIFVNNVPLEVAAETGLLGLICLAWLGVSIFNMLRLTIRRSREPFEQALAVGLLASAAGLVVQYMTASPFYAEWTWFALGAGGALYNLVSLRAAGFKHYVEHKESVTPNYE